MISCTAPHYLPDLLELYTTSHTLHTCADDKLFHIPNRCKKFSRRAHHFFLPLPPPLGLEQSPFLCVTCSNCLPSSYSSRRTFSLSLSPNTFNCLQPTSSKCACGCMHVSILGSVCVWLMTNLCMLILSVSVQLCTIRCVCVCWK